MQLLVQPCRNRPAEFARSSLSACGLPTPVVALACIGNVDIQVLFGAGCQLYFIRRLQVFASLEKGGGPPLGGGGSRPRSATSSAAMSKPSGGIRSLPSLSAWGLPTPVVAFACSCNVVFLRCYSCRRVTFIFTAFASL